MESGQLSNRCLVVGNAPLHDVFRDLIAGLEGRGWRIDVKTFAFQTPPSSQAWRHLEAALSQGNGLLRTSARAARRVQREMAGAPAASAWFEEVETTLTRGRYDVVLAVVDVAPIGLARLVARTHPRVVLVTLLALTQERQHRRLLPTLRAAAGMASRRRLHGDLLRAIEPQRLPVTVFPSQTWRDTAVAAGVPPNVARVIPLGVSIPPDVPARPADLAPTARLLWVGRLSPEKGLHAFLEALPLVAAKRPVTLTAIAGAGPAGYTRQIADTIARHRLEGIVRICPAVPRREMIEAYARHDLLLFHSVYPEPVAQVLLHAGAAGLPVVGPASGSERSLLRDGQTAWCYRDQSAEQVADAVLRALGDGPERTKRARALRDEVRESHDLAQTIDRYDALLRQLSGADAFEEARSCQTVHC